MSHSINPAKPLNVLITGATSGIGAGISRAFVAHGHSVTASGATEREVEAARADPALAGVAFKQLDVRDGDSVTALVGALGPLDVLVNCAGVIRREAEHDPRCFRGSARYQPQWNHARLRRSTCRLEGAARLHH